MADAVVDTVVTVTVGGRLRPMLKLKPTGAESGFRKRRSLRAVWVGAEHVRLISPGPVEPDEDRDYCN
ncbi:hypothetical protein ACFXDE_15945 [Kitasatospora sp. NPDC059408]|uniref:hypothetical protein n=1 Tax=Kitasatospora sp. NPDC059408 TaxID=3346823 RepID=UPI003678EDA5